MVIPQPAQTTIPSPPIARKLEISHKTLFSVLIKEIVDVFRTLNWIVLSAQDAKKIKVTCVDGF
jgi:hypothetical protein